LLVAESRAGQYKHLDIENAAHHLHGMLEGRKAESSAPKRSRPTPNASRGTRHPQR
jgi:hypothetical protein